MCAIHQCGVHCNISYPPDLQSKLALAVETSLLHGGEGGGYLCPFLSDPFGTLGGELCNQNQPIHLLDINLSVLIYENHFDYLYSEG